MTIAAVLSERMRDLFGDSAPELEEAGEFADFCLPPGKIGEIETKTGLAPEKIAGKIDKALRKDCPGFIDSVSLANGYVNIRLASKVFLEELGAMVRDIDGYFSEAGNRSRMAVFDHSSPNIAKPFSVGHLRSTIIGQANLKIHEAIGYRTVGINYLGDWGTQFGKLIVAIKKWVRGGRVKQVIQNPIKELNLLYTTFHVLAKDDDRLNEEARRWFKKLEDGDKEALEIWQKCVSWSMGEFERIYKMLAVEFDETVGESFYRDKMEAVVGELREKKLLKESEGALIVELDGMPPALIQKRDGATLYFTRDLAALKDRIARYSPEKIVYHVGGDQYLHFRQLEAVAKKLGWLEKNKIVFAGHGMIRLPEGKMSTRSGRVILLEDLVGEARKRAASLIALKNPAFAKKEELSRSIAVSAIKYAGLSQNRKSDIVFSFDKMISLKGNSGPYLQYGYARSESLLREFTRRHGALGEKPHLGKEALALSRALSRLKMALVRSAENSSPHLFCEAVFRSVEQFNRFYEKERLIDENKAESEKRLYPVLAFNRAVRKSFEILGLAPLKEI